MITVEINRIGGCRAWRVLIDNLLEHFDGIEFEAHDLAPAEEIAYILRQIRSDDPEQLKEKLFLQKMSQLEAFQHRAMKVVDSGIETWNPLNQSFKEFVKEANNLYTYQDGDRFPPPDVVRANFSHKLHILNRTR